MKTLNPAVARVLKRSRYPLDVILTCVRWYVAYPLSLRHLEGKMLNSEKTSERRSPCTNRLKPCLRNRL
jgi:hypothetical protein